VKKKMLIRDYIGRRVKSKRSLRNGYGGMPAGTVYTVEGTWRSGFSLRAEACAHCGFRFSVSHVHRDAVELVEEAP